MAKIMSQVILKISSTDKIQLIKDQIKFRDSP